MKRKIVVGSRDSALAVAQTRLVMDALAAAHPGLELELVTMKTTGDLVLDRSLDQIGGKGLFVRELDRALWDGRVDLTVHSLKDLPMETPAGLPLLAYFRRGDPRDALVLPQGAGAVDPSKPIGCGSARRVLQLKTLYPGVETRLVRGNVLTRLQKLDAGEYSALVLAAAGLRRLGLEGRISRLFEPDEMLPAAGQGILAVQGRAGEELGFLAAVDDPAARACALAERAFVRALDGGCSAPIAAYAELDGGRLRLAGLYCGGAGGPGVSGRCEGDAADAERLGEALALRLKKEAGA